MHNGLPLSLSDFLLVIAMLLVTPSEEWMNVTRTSPSDSFLDDGSPSDLSLGILSSNGLPSSSLSSRTFNIAALLHTSKVTPKIDRWRSSIPARAKDDNHSRYAESIDGSPASGASPRATSRLSSHTDNHAAVQHSAYTSGQGVYATHSGPSLSLASHAPPPGNRIEELASCHDYRLLKDTPIPVGYLRRRHSRVSQDELPPLPPLPTTHFPTGATLAYKPGLCPSTSYSCITKFEYTQTFASRSPDPIISKTTDSSITHHAEPFQSRVTRLRAWLFDTASPTSTTITILHSSSECFLLPLVATRLQLTHRTTKLLREHARSIPSFTSSGPGPDRTRKYEPISEHPDDEYLARVLCGSRQEHELQSRPVEVGLGFW
ncbi:hypothetical protein EDB83DRAFT_1831248 [Lactarius deliciosus]|nr:hypothetical protein EDB83DRAFT_1831248 [Lactarius deliciosus]